MNRASVSFHPPRYISSRKHENVMSRRLPIAHKERILSKRIFDIVFSMMLVVLLAPLFGIITLAIWFSTGRRAIYAQPRLGCGGKLFYCYKFRTMCPDADKKLREILLTNPQLHAEWQISQKLKDDPRVYPLGRWLRKTSLDELPQFWNVLKGDLSIVGPRPYLWNQKNEMGEMANQILSVHPGITGPWQTSGRSSTTFEERLSLDAAYSTDRSFWFDLKLIVKTVPQIFFHQNAC